MSASLSSENSFFTQMTNKTIKILPWILSLVLTAALGLGVLMLKNTPKQEEELVTVRKIDVALPIPPPPPPMIEMKQSATEAMAPSINLSHAGSGPAISYSNKPSLGQPKVAQLSLPKFEFSMKDFSKTLDSDFPVMEVKSLDKVPKVVFSKYFAPPRSVTQRGVKRIATKVSLIIDQQGKPFIQRIIDPVYPEMEITIRNWVEHARFSVPKKDGKPVKAIYIYGLNFNHGR